MQSSAPPHTSVPHLVEDFRAHEGRCSRPLAEPTASLLQPFPSFLPNLPHASTNILAASKIDGLDGPGLGLGRQQRALGLEAEIAGLDVA